MEFIRVDRRPDQAPNHWLSVYRLRPTPDLGEATPEVFEAVIHGTLHRCLVRRETAFLVTKSQLYGAVHDRQSQQVLWRSILRRKPDGV